MCYRDSTDSCLLAPSQWCLILQSFLLIKKAHSLCFSHVHNNHDWIKDIGNFIEIVSKIKGCRTYRLYIKENGSYHFMPPHLEGAFRLYFLV